MGNTVLVACTNVGRSIIEEIMNNPNINTQISGIVNLNSTQAMTKANYDSYADLAIKFNLDIHYCDNVNDASTLDFIRSKKPDIILQSGWSQKFRDELLAIPTYGCIGEHPAPLPKGRGAACINWAILTGETKWGDSFFKMVSEYDKGDLLAQSHFNITEYDDVYTVYQKVARSSAKIVSKYIDDWCNGKFNSIAQDDTKATYYKRRTPKDGEIHSFNLPAKELHDFIRAQTKPYPCAYITINQKKVLLLSSALVKNSNTNAPAGFVVSATENGGIIVSCKDGESIELLRIQEDGMPEEWACDWCSRRRLLRNILIDKR